MTKYDIIFESLQDQVDAGELAVETAEYLNDVAYEMYGDEDVDGLVAESYDDIVEDLQYKVESGMISLETAEYLNDLAYDIFTESDEDDFGDGELLSEAVDYLETLCDDYNI